MKILKYSTLCCLSVLMLVSASAWAKFKLNKPEFAALETVALVSTSFGRQNSIELTDIDPEFIMMQEAGDRIIAAIAAKGTFSITPLADVTGNAQYDALTTNDPGLIEKHNRYWPNGYRKVELKKEKDNAVALCEALGVDAVVQVHFSGYMYTKGMMFKKKEHLVLTGAITMVDKNGKLLISEKVKSEAVEIGTKWAIGNGMEISTEAKVPGGLYPELLNTYMANLEKALNK